MLLNLVVPRSLEQMWQKAEAGANALQAQAPAVNAALAATAKSTFGTSSQGTLKETKDLGGSNSFWHIPSPRKKMAVASKKRPQRNKKTCVHLFSMPPDPEVLL